MLLGEALRVLTASEVLVETVGPPSYQELLQCGCSVDTNCIG